MQVVQAPPPSVSANITNLKPPPFVSPSASSATKKSVASVKGSDKHCFSDTLYLKDSVVLDFAPLAIHTVLKNEKGQRIIEVCIWLQSGVDLEMLSVSVEDDMKTLKVQQMMDDLMQNGRALHMDLVPREKGSGKRPNKKDIANHVRVHHWNSIMDEMRSGNGLLPRFVADIPLPEEVCSKKILRQVGKESTWGSRFLLIDLLVEDSKIPRIEKRSFELISEDVLRTCRCLRLIIVGGCATRHCPPQYNAYEKFT